MNSKLKKIISILGKELPKLKTNFQVLKLEIFGSFVREQQSTNSDLDILVTFSEVPDLFKFIELENYLSELLHLKVDLVMRSALKPNIGKRILSEARPVL